MGTEPEEDQSALGFREPPPCVTLQCMAYMARIMEIRGLVAFFFNFVKTSAELGNLISEEVKAETAKTAPKAFTLLQYNFSDHRPLVNELLLSRAVESFDLYLTKTLRDIFLARPEMLKSEQQLDAGSIIEAGSYDEVILRLVERRINELSYKSLAELRKYVRKGTGIDLFETEAIYECVVLASEVRNLIAHNDTVVNAQFTARTKGISVPLDRSRTGRLRIDDAWLRRTSYTLDAVVFRFDELVAAKFGVKTLPLAEWKMWRD
ncbi:hypothetical protein [Pelagibacterium sp.]|uniref:hypothetical protein n=1 Tax=Pelagibacterium sp. TaxID=1967288 RepID=UPI003BAD5F8D